MGENVENKKNKARVGIGVAGGVVVCLVIAYLAVGLYYKSHIFSNVTINGVDVSNMSAKQIRDNLDETAKNYTLTIYERDDKQETIDGKDFDLEYYYDDALDEIIASQSIFAWGLHLFGSSDYDLDLMAEYDSDKLEGLIDGLDCMDKKSMVSPEDAYLDYNEEDGLRLIPEIMGSTIDDNNMHTILTQAIESAQSEINLYEAGAYVDPKVYSDDKDLIARYELMTKYLAMVITYHFDDEEEVLDRNTFYDWISETNKGTVEFDKDMIKDYVKTLASKHNTAYRKHELATSYGQTITISNGSYGWIIDQEAERDELYEVLMAGESQDREPIYSQTAASHTGNDYGNTYVEINLSAQHLFFYVDGELLIESDFVSGNELKGWATPGGIFPLTYKERNATLRGTNYATPVSYWMPFNGNIGMHDSTWRSSYGKNIYKTNGSHGCINLPPSVAEVIFDNIEKGMPVLCYYLSGTEYKSNEPETEVVEESESTEAIASEEATVVVETPAEETPIVETPVEEIPVTADQGTGDTDQLQ